MLFLATTWADLQNLWPHVTAIGHIVVATLASTHVVLWKRDNRAAIGWAGLIWFSPFLGAALYWGFGINRIRRKAHALRGQPYDKLQRATQVGHASSAALHAGAEKASLLPLATLVRHVTQQPLLAGNKIVPLAQAGALEQMLSAIEGAEKSVALETYIFDNSQLGQRFVTALAAAKQRGVQVRVIIDDIGSRYSRPSIIVSLRRAGLPVARFMHTLIPFWSSYANLRNHRKILVVDGRLGFTGGMNIRGGEPGSAAALAMHDTHFQIEGPVVAHLQQTFVDDWLFCTEENLSGELWFPPLEPAGDIAARGIDDGPDDDLDKLHLAIMGALACAESSVSIVTPYFLPDAALIAALNVAALRGVAVNIVLPQVNNLALVQWASTAQLWQVLQRGCKVWLTAPPFDHSKLMVVDRTWSLVGSGNWDPRSLRLNFEFNLECYSRSLAGQIVELIEAKLRHAKQITLADVDGRPLPTRLRDGVARLFSPYL